MCCDIFMLAWLGVIWTGVGVLILFVLFSINKTPVCQAKGLEFLNPVWLWKQYKLNVFGAIILAASFSVLCPPLTIGYWFYKLCTAGR